MIERHPLVHVLIMHLLKRQFDITPYRHATIFKCTAVSSFHYARSSTRHGGKSYICNAFTKLTGTVIILMIFFKTCRTKNRNAGTNKMKSAEAFYKLIEHP